MPENQNATLIASLKALLAHLEAPAGTTAVPKLLDMDPRFTDPTLPPEQRSKLLGEVIAPYLSPDGKYFARDFWMRDLMGAMAGALVADYNQMNIMIGMMGSGSKPRHLYIVGPDDPNKLPNEVMTSPGTPVAHGGPGWEPRGENYRYDNAYDHATNLRAWIEAGAPKENDLGSWANNGLPLAYVQETWKHPSSRDLDQPGFPGAGRNRGRNR